MAKTLDLDPEFGDVDFIQELEKVFGVRLTQSDVGDWLTIGDVYDTLRTYIDDRLWRDGACMRAMAFRRLRHPLAKLAPNRKAHPILGTYGNSTPKPGGQTQLPGQTLP